VSVRPGAIACPPSRGFRYRYTNSESMGICKNHVQIKHKNIKNNNFDEINICDPKSVEIILIKTSTILYYTLYLHTYVIGCTIKSKQTNTEQFKVINSNMNIFEKATNACIHYTQYIDRLFISFTFRINAVYNSIDLLSCVVLHIIIIYTNSR